MEERLFPNDKVIITECFDVHQDWEIPIPGLFIIASTKDRVSLVVLAVGVYQFSKVQL